MYAMQLLKPGTEEHYRMSLGQITVFAYGDHKLENILTEDGLALLQEIEDKVENKEHKDILTEARVKDRRTGSWTKDREHRYYKDNIDACSKESEMMMCSWDDKAIEGKNRDGVEITTSIIRLMNLREGWVYTYTGSLYLVVMAKKE